MTTTRTKTILSRTPIPQPDQYISLNLEKIKRLGNLTEDEGDSSTFPTTQIHDGVMNAIN
jgi:hypothetical protein